MLLKWVSHLLCSSTTAGGVCKPGLAEFAADVVLRMFVFGILKYLTRFAEFNQVPGPAALSRIDVKKARIISYALRLLKVVGDDCDGETLAKFCHQFFDLARGNGIERGTWLIHQEHFRFGRDCSARCIGAAAAHRRAPGHSY